MNEQELQKLISELQNGSDQQRRAASYKLGKSKNPAAVPALISAYNDSDGSVRQNVFDGLRSIGSKEALDFLASHKDNIMNVLPSMDSKTIKCDSNGVVTIKPMPLLVYVMGVIIGIFGIGAFARGEILLGISGVVAGIIIFLRARNMGTIFEFNPKTRIFKIGSNSNAIAIPFDDIAGFGVSSEKETGNFTEEIILVMLKDGRGINIGVITDANEKKRQEKVSNMTKFLYEATGIVLNVNEYNQSGVEKN
jgi:hypothetical protein